MDKKEIKKMKKRICFLPLNLQFFADDDGGEPDKNDNQDTNDTGDAGENTNTRTFTQEEVNQIGANEKRQGKAAILKALGCKSEAEAKKKIDGYNAFVKFNAQSGQNETDSDNNKELQEVELRAVKAEQKLSAVMAGVEKTCIDDVLAIASLKVTEEKDLDAVLKEMKEDKRYTGFFESKSSGVGTGNGIDHNRNNSGSKPGDIGARLAGKKNDRGKSSYFKD